MLGVAARDSADAATAGVVTCSTSMSDIAAQDIVAICCHAAVAHLRCEWIRGAV